MTFVYLLYNYEEHGPDDCAATLDREKLSELIVPFYTAQRDYPYWNKVKKGDVNVEGIAEARKNLSEITDWKVGTYYIGGISFGALELQVLELDTFFDNDGQYDLQKTD